MSSFSDRCAHEDEQDRLALVAAVLAARAIYHPHDKQSTPSYVDPYDVAADWRERA